MLDRRVRRQLTVSVKVLVEGSVRVLSYRGSGEAKVGSHTGPDKLQL